MKNRIQSLVLLVWSLALMLENFELRHELNALRKIVGTLIADQQSLAKASRDNSDSITSLSQAQMSTTATIRILAALR